MKRLDVTDIERWRIGFIHPWDAGPEGGAFLVLRDGYDLLCLATTGGGWDHVSVTRHNPDGTVQTATCDDMEYVKRLLFREDETAMQLHVPPGEHVNVHPHCLHLWRPQHADILRPPANMVA